MIVELTKELNDPSGKSLYDAWRGRDQDRDGPKGGLLPDVGALRAALASSLRDSRVAVLVTAVTPPQTEPAVLGEAVFTSLKEALAWLTEPAH